MSHFVLGLDLGPNSIGWALIDDNKDNPDKSKIVDLGVRVFPEGVDAWDTAKEASRNEQRRLARGMRRQHRRRARRKQQLIAALIESNLWPDDASQQTALLSNNPYELRARALDEPISLHQFGRILIHLNGRRGFKSNKKEEAKAEAKAKRKKASTDEDRAGPPSEAKTEDILLEMARLEKEIKELGLRTLGEYLHKKCTDFNHSQRVENDMVRGRHTKRSMLIEEFELLWEKQAGFHPELTEKLRYGSLGRQKDIHRPLPKHDDFLDKERSVPNRRKGLSDLDAFGLFGCIFFHRTLKPVPKEIVGLCKLEPRARRCPRASRRAQQFRIFQEINNLRFIDPNVSEEFGLDNGQRKLLLDYLFTREKATFTEIRKKLGFLESVKFNLEKGKRSTLQGMVTDCLMAKAIGKQWHGFPEETKDGVVDALIKSVDDDDTHELLVERYGLTADQADLALSVELPEGYTNLSLIAINKLLPFLKEGLVFEHRDPEKSARAKAGYDDPWALRQRIFDKLPDPRRTADSPIGDIPNPVVKRTLTEVRKVVNAIVREYGRKRIKEIHVEMGRDVKTRPKPDPRNPAYRKYLDQIEEMREREKKRDLAKQKLRESNIPFGTAGINILKYLLWEEQNEVCAYSGKIISFSQLFTSEVEIDHILPRSRSLDDSQMNKVVCFRDENHGSTGKGQRTPRQWLEHSNPEKYEAMCQRAKKLPYSKYQRFLRKDAKPEDFIERQLNDTRYIAKATVEYLKCLFDHDANKRGAVLGLKGQLTSTLRRQWGLDSILEELKDGPAWRDDGSSKLRFGQKNRADHRHHAIDAVVLAMTNRNRLTALANGFAVDAYIEPESGETKYKSFYEGELIPLPWKEFRRDVCERIASLDGDHTDDGQRRGVSHRVERKIKGGLHKDNPFGSVNPGTPGYENGQWVKRKPLADLSAGEILQIRDAAIRETVIVTLRENSIEVKIDRSRKGRPKIEFVNVTTEKKPPDKELLAVLSQVKMVPSRVPIKKVRLIVKNDTIQQIREVKAEKNGDVTQLAYVEPGSTHHLCIFEWMVKGKKKRDAVFVTMINAMNRIKLQQRELAKQVKDWKKVGLSDSEIKKRSQAAMSEIAKLYPVIQRDASKLEGEDRERIPAEAKFVMSLSSREMVLANWKGEEKLLTFKTAASTQGQIYFAEHTDARRSSEQQKFVATANSLDARKVTVDPLGRIRWAND